MVRVSSVLAAVCGLALASCDNGPSAVETRERAEASAQPMAMAAMPVEAATAETAAQPVKATITTARDESVDGKIKRLFERNGAAFGAASASDYLAKAQAFITSPPAGTETATRRRNGDTLFYQASTNTFAVADRDGVLRTMFKPDDGAAYWAKEKARAGQARSSG